MPEFKILTSTKAEDAQKLLNQWRHDFTLKIHGFTAHSDGTVSLIAERTRNVQPN